MVHSYVTTSIPYVNAPPHVGHALELVQADAIARYLRLCAQPTILQTGTDENASKNVAAAQVAGVSPRTLVDRNAARFRQLVDQLDVAADVFVRTADPHHAIAVQRFWQLLQPDDLYRRAYRGLYCRGCEDYYHESALDDGRCPEHQTPVEVVDEQNYFFRLSRYQHLIEDALSSGRLQVIPEQRRREVLRFVQGGLTDISVSREAARAASWGVPVPDDPSQVVYVWIDALINYVSGQGFGAGDGWQSVWNAQVHKLHVIGKNVWKFHAVHWLAMLASAGLPLPNELFVHGFLTAEGAKISKSLANTIDPFEQVARFGCDAVRFYLLQGFVAAGDGDYAERRLTEAYNVHLANGLGNLVCRLLGLAARADVALAPIRAAHALVCDQVHRRRRDGTGTDDRAPAESSHAGLADYHAAMRARRFDVAFAALWRLVRTCNREIDTAAPWNRQPSDPEIRRQLTGWLQRVHTIAHWAQPFIPQAAVAVSRRLAEGAPNDVPLFPRL